MPQGEMFESHGSCLGFCFYCFYQHRLAVLIANWKALESEATFDGVLSDEGPANRSTVALLAVSSGAQEWETGGAMSYGLEDNFRKALTGGTCSSYIVCRRVVL